MHNQNGKHPNQTPGNPDSQDNQTNSDKQTPGNPDSPANPDNQTNPANQTNQTNQTNSDNQSNSDNQTNPANQSSPLPPGIRRAEDLPLHLGFRTGYSTVSDGNMSYTFGPKAEVLASRRAFFNREGLPTHRLATFFTDHRDQITDLEDIDFPFGQGPLNGALALTTDVIVTTQPGTGVFLGFADCVPFVVCDPQKKVLAFAHIGWRSMAVSLAHKLLTHLQNRYCSRPKDLIAVIGPSIKPWSYHFHEPTQWQDPAWHPHLKRLPNGKTAIDLFGFCVADCERAGLQREQIYAHWTDTATDPNLFSHYQATEGKQPHKQGRHFFYGYLEE